VEPAAEPPIPPWTTMKPLLLIGLLTLALAAREQLSSQAP
jgi:hypothetical protein